MALFELGGKKRRRKNPPPSTSKRHPGVEFEVEDPSLPDDHRTMFFHTFGEAASNAIVKAYAHGGPVYLDVIVLTEEGAEWVAGDDGVERYKEDPEASVFERIVIHADNQGRIP